MPGAGRSFDLDARNLESTVGSRRADRRVFAQNTRTMAIIGSLATVRTQLQTSPALAAAFDHVERCLTPGTEESRRVLGFAAGDSNRVDLAHGAFALEQSYLTKPDEKARWETHKAYIDVQAVITGSEVMEAAESGELTVSEDLTPEKDVVFYQPYAGGSRLRAGEGFVAVFFPADAHRPSLALDESAQVRKVVVKVPV